MDEVLVVGAGVIGLTTAVVLGEAGYAVRIRSAQRPEQTTSMVAGALLGPIIPWGDERADRWSLAADRIFRSLALNPGTGVRVDRGRLISNFGNEMPPWAAAVPGFAPCAGQDRPDAYTIAFWVELPVADMRRYLPYLQQRAAAAGATIEIDPIASVAEAARLASIVVNCTGAAARHFASDPSVTSVKGQHVIVRNPGLDTFCFEGGAVGSWTGFFPHGDRVVLGGIERPDDWDLQPDAVATAEIVARCAAVEPRLAGAEVLAVEVGLRPQRPSARVEVESVDGTAVVHNYGHGGVGVMHSWGSASDVLDLVEARAS